VLIITLHNSVTLNWYEEEGVEVMVRLGGG